MINAKDLITGSKIFNPTDKIIKLSLLVVDTTHAFLDQKTSKIAFPTALNQNMSSLASTGFFPFKLR